MSRNTSKTNFKKVCDFNEAFDVTCYDGDMNTIFNSMFYNSTNINLTDLIRADYLKVFNLRCDLVIEEANELLVAYNNDCRKEMRDAVCDLLYVLYGIGYTYNFDMNDIECSNIYYDENLLNPVNILNKANEIKTCKNFNVFRDSVIELVKIVFDYGNKIKFNVNDDFDIVHRSNMSKICDDEQTAIDTVESYIKRHIYDPVKTPYDSPYYYKINLNGEDKYIVKNKSTGKVLKSIKYFEVEFD